MVMCTISCNDFKAVSFSTLKRKLLCFIYSRSGKKVQIVPFEPWNKRHMELKVLNINN